MITNENSIDKIFMENEKMKKRMCIKEGFIVLTINHSEVNILLTDCNTPEKLLKKAYHLTEKAWITREDIRYFIELLSKENNIMIH